MPTVRYPVQEWHVVAAQDAVEWGRQVHYDPQRAIVWFETEVDTEADVDRLQTAYVEDLMPRYNTGYWTPSRQEQLWNTWSTTTTVSTTPIYNTEWQDGVWNTWTTTGSYTIQYTRPEPMRPPSEEVREAARQRREERDQEYRERAERLAREREEAQARSLELLRVVLSAAEYRRYEEAGVIEIRGSAGTRFRINQRGYSGNVEVITEEGRRIATLCAHPRMFTEGNNLPPGDAWVGQILALKADEEAFLAVANIHGLNHDGEPEEVVVFQERHRQLRQARVYERRNFVLEEDAA